MEEKQLIRSCLQGNEEDFKKIMDMYSPKAMAMAVNILGNRDDAEDACQDAFLHAYLNLARFDQERNFKNWLYSILYRRCLDQLRRRRRVFVLFQKLQRESSAPPSSKPDPCPGEDGLPSQLLHLLKPKERTVLCLWANEGYTSQEIAEVLRCSASTARVHLFQARRKIKKALEKRDASL